MAKDNELCWPDARGWIGVGVYGLVIFILMLIWVDPTLREDEFFKTISTLIIGTAFVNGVVSWAYAATKGGGELADRNANVVEAVAASVPPQNGQPQEVVVVNPVHVEPAADSEELPDYARD